MGGGASRGDARLLAIRVAAALGVGLLGVGLAGCSGVAVLDAESGDAVVEPDALDSSDLPGTHLGPDVRIDGRSVLLVPDGVDGVDGARELVRLTEEDGEPVYASLRPGDHDVDVVLLLNRVEDGLGARFELRYLSVDADAGVSELYWFPWRLQIDEGVAAVLDVPPLPVWSPDGGTVAWIEWAADGTRLRTVGWYSDERSNNPSDAAAAYVLREVPPGAQLEAWEIAPDGDPILVARGDRITWRIELDVSRSRHPDRVA